MWQNIDQFEKETQQGYLDTSALLLQLIDYRGDLNGENEADPLLWTGGSPVAGQSCMAY